MTHIVFQINDTSSCNSLLSSYGLPRREKASAEMQFVCVSFVIHHPLSLDQDGPYNNIFFHSNYCGKIKHFMSSYWNKNQSKLQSTG